MPRTDADFWGMTTTNTIKVVWAWPWQFEILV
jgi:hypothetical protein